ncbi:MAG: DUF4905 domain-containing protein [Bacteroidota bacterium]
MNLLQKFAFNFDARIWRILPGLSEGLLVLEMRDTEKKHAYFVIIRPESGEICCDRIEPEQGWWYGMEAISGNVLLLHSYEEGQVPAHKAIYAFDARTGKKLWENLTLRFICAENNFVWAYDTTGTGETPVLKIELYTGRIISESSEQEIGAGHPSFRKLNGVSEFSGTDSSMPMIYNEGGPYFATLAEYIRTKLNGSSPVQRIEYLESEGHVMISWYSRELSGAGNENAGTLNNHLLVTDLEGEVELDTTLGTLLPGVAETTFFTFGTNLIYPANQGELYCYTLLRKRPAFFA